MNKTTRRVVGNIITSGDQFVIPSKGVQFDARELVAAGRSHREIVSIVAVKYFGVGLLRKYTSTELPCAEYAAYGWTRETRPNGEVSINVDHYQVLAVGE